MFSYLSAVPATNSSVVLAMMVASLLPLGFAILAKLFGGFQIGLELLVINGLLTFIGLLMISKKA